MIRKRLEILSPFGRDAEQHATLPFAEEQRIGSTRTLHGDRGPYHFAHLAEKALRDRDPQSTLTEIVGGTKPFASCCLSGKRVQSFFSFEIQNYLKVISMFLWLHTFIKQKIVFLMKLRRSGKLT